jgi:hypothetical protein
VVRPTKPSLAKPPAPQGISLADAKKHWQGELDGAGRALDIAYTEKDAASIKYFEAITAKISDILDHADISFTTGEALMVTMTNALEPAMDGHR